MNRPAVVSAEEWLTTRKKLLADAAATFSSEPTTT